MLNVVEEQFKNFMCGYNLIHNDINKKFNNEKIKMGILYSCGVDSSVLLHVANKYKDMFDLEIEILYVSFNDFKNSKQADDLVVQMSSVYNNKFHCEICDLASKSSGIKMTARDSMKSIAFKSDFDIVLTGHHRDDQIETVLFRLFRGSGVEGLCGMDFLTDYIKDDKKRLFGKPFLNIKKTEIIEYARLYDIYFIEDETNYCSDNSDRNYIRNNIVPMIEHRFEIDSLVSTIGNIKQHINQKNERNINIDIYSGTWNINDFINLSPGNRLFIIREYFRAIHGYNFNQKVLREIQRKLNEDISTLCIHLNNRFMIARHNDNITCEYSRLA